MRFEFKPYRAQARDEWETFVRGNPHAWPGHATAAMRLEEVSGHRNRSLMAYSTETGELQGVIPLFEWTERRSRIFRYRGLSTGNQLRGAPLLKPGMGRRVVRDFWAELAAYLRRMGREGGVDEIMVAFPHHFGVEPVHAVYPYLPLREYGYREQNMVTLVLDLPEDGEALMAGFDKKARGAIRYARKEGASFEPIEHRDTWMGCYELNLETFEGEPASALSRRKMEILWEEFVEGGWASVFGVRHQGRIIGTKMLVGTAEVQYAWYAFNHQPDRLRGAAELLVYETLCRMMARGVKIFELGTIEFGNERQRGIGRFKQRFGGRPRYGMEGKLTLSPLKAATEQWLKAFWRK